MSTILSNIVQNTTDINDEIIAGNMLASAKSAADAYLNATMTSTTPELRAIYSSSLTQVVTGHSALTELNVNKGWINPYNPPTQQLSDIVNKTEMTVK
ncbi:spore coat protein [Inconstantimicrobium mannanitabidum]|uniref:Spore coat protein n=1 Tax=Inconstantimicrobium mannanitabidum TaxID=1604901 RepID=A0ACB5R837_9CLOT|nr:spore coat protein [Clostridium sp. TW13]GKX65186.1 spore coat protein [Clostridium sp. TW13]